jgi:adhesin/invasin
VTWAVTTGGGSVSAPQTVTDATGLASVDWRVGDTVTTNTLTASIVGATVTVTAMSLAASVSGLVKVSPDSQAVAAGGTLPIVAMAVDRFGNPVPNVSVTWSSTAGSLSVLASTTGPGGNATSNFTTDGAPSIYFVTAAIAGKATVTFKVSTF